MAKHSTVVNRKEIRNPFDALSYLDSLKFDHVYMIVGSDRVKEFERNVPKYIGTQYKNIKKLMSFQRGNEILMLQEYLVCLPPK